jgi:hypothetical protein
LGDVPLCSTMVASVDVLNAAPEVAQSVVAAIWHFKLANLSQSWVAAQAHYLSVVANLEVAIVVALLHKDCVPVIRPLAFVAVATQLAEKGVREALAALTTMRVNNLDAVGVPVWGIWLGS